MRKLSAPIVVLLTVLTGAAGNAQAAPPQQAAPPAQAVVPAAPGVTGMEAFTSTEGLFSVELPGTPKQAAKPFSLLGGEASTLHQFWVDLDSDNITYMVIYNDYPADYASAAPRELLQTMRDGVVRDKTLTSDVPMDLFGVPGRAFTALDKDGWQYAVHQFLDGTRLYQLIVVNNKEHPAPRTEQFMNSFRILKSSTGAPDASPAPPAG